MMISYFISMMKLCFRVKNCSCLYSHTWRGVFTNEEKIKQCCQKKLCCKLNFLILFIFAYIFNNQHFLTFILCTRFLLVFVFRHCLQYLDNKIKFDLGQTDTQDLIRWSKLSLRYNTAYFSFQTNSLPPRLSRDLTNMYMFSLYQQTHQVVAVYICVCIC